MFGSIFVWVTLPNSFGASHCCSTFSQLPKHPPPHGWFAMNAIQAFYSSPKKTYFSFFQKHYFQISDILLFFSLVSFKMVLPFFPEMLPWFFWSLWRFESLEPQKLRSRYLAPSLNTWRISTFFWNSGDAGTGARGEPAIQEQKQAGFPKKNGWKVI